MKEIKNASPFIVALTVLSFGRIFLFTGPPASAQSQTDNPVVQTGEGVGKIITSPVKIPEEIVDDVEERVPVTVTVTGTVNGIAEAVKFFHLNALSSPILVKVHFDVVMTMVADTLYTMLAHKLRGFEDCDAPKINRHFVRGKGTIIVKDRIVNVIYPRRAHNPILRAVPWDDLPCTLPGLSRTKLGLNFQ